MADPVMARSLHFTSSDGEPGDVGTVRKLVDDDGKGNDRNMLRTTDVQLTASLCHFSLVADLVPALPASLAHLVFTRYAGRVCSL